MDLSDEIYDYLCKTLSLDGTIVGDAARYVALNRGHMWRPTVTVRTAEMYGVPRSKIMPFAAGIELVHGATLVLDDMPSMDDSPMRRGKKSCHLEFGEDIAELCSHYLVSLSDLITAKSEVTDKQYRDVIKETKSTALNLIQGQEIDLHNLNIDSPEEIDRFYGMKSGSLYASAAVIGGIIGDAYEDELKYLRAFGMNLGIAYQYGDDLYDFLGNPEDLGKPTGQDAGKKTPIDILGVEGTKKVRKKFEDAARESLKNLPRDVSSLDELITKVTGTHQNFDQY
jgi:geranylgeranyl diphosphate synthase type II